MRLKDKLLHSRLQIARADLSIGECIRKMREANIGALVIVSDNIHEELVGIFTERDLLKNIELLMSKKLWDRPIRTVMTKTVRFVSPDNLNEAGRLMLKYRIRHLPIVTIIRERKKVVGVLSIRDLFQNLMENYTKDITQALLPNPENLLGTVNEFSVLSRDASINKFLSDSFANTPYILIKRISPRHLNNQMALVTGLYSLRSLILDIDDLSFMLWAKLLKHIYADKNVAHVIIIYSPENHSPKEIQILHKLMPAKKFSVLSKPIDIVAFFRIISARINGVSEQPMLNEIKR